MSSFFFPLHLLTICLLFSFTSIRAQQLTAVRASVSLPSSRAHTVTHFDGSDTVYILSNGLDNSGQTPEILKYYISNDTIEWIGYQPAFLDAGALVSTPDGYLYFFGGDVFSTTIHRFSPNTPEAVENFTTVPRFSNMLSSAVKWSQESEDFFIFGGVWEGDQIFRCDPSSEFTPTELVGRLPRALMSGVAVSDGVGSTYLFGHPYGSNTYSDGVAINLTTFEIRMASDPLPPLWGRPTGVWTGQDVLLLGGYLDSSGGSIIRVDPVTLRHRIVRVLDFPTVPNGELFYGSSAIYVEALDRVYFFGGMSSSLDKINGPGEGLFDGIWYIDLQSGKN